MESAGPGPQNSDVLFNLVTFRILLGELRGMTVNWKLLEGSAGQGLSSSLHGASVQTLGLLPYHRGHWSARQAGPALPMLGA